MAIALDDLDPASVLVRAGEAVVARRAAEVDDLRLVSRWAVLHGSDPRRDPGGSGHDYLVPVGGEGTPWVRELCLSELAVVRGVHVLSLRAVMADVLDLQHRLPRTWAVVEALQAEAWVARRVASLSRVVPVEHVGVVDAAVSVAIAGQAPSRVLEIAQAKVVEADPAGHAARLAQARRRRFVSLSRTDEHGLRHVIARVQAGDAVYVDAMVDRVADILAAKWAEEHPDPGPGVERPGRDVFRSEAFGWLGRPAEALALLLEHARVHEPSRVGEPGVVAPGFTPVADWEAGAGTGWEPGWVPVDHDPDEPDDPEEPHDPGDPRDPDEPEGHRRPLDPLDPLDPPDLQDPPDPEPAPDPESLSGGGLVGSRMTAFPADLLAALRSIDPVRLRPAAVLYAHVSDQGLAHPMTGVARLEECGPVLAAQLADLLAHSHVTLKPVIDLADDISVLAYEHPVAVKERVWLRHLGDAFPYANATTRRVDYDHPDPYRSDGPPGQTGTHNSQPLGRRSHRHKTHAGYTSRQVGPATHVWRTPHGHYYLRGPTGTHPLTPDDGAAYLAADEASLPFLHAIRRQRTGHTMRLHALA